MEHMKNLATESSQHAIAQTPLIHGLPDDVALLCLAKVPRTYHANLKCVSKRWRELVCGEELDSFRKKHKLSETWIYALCEDAFDCERLCCYVLDPYTPKMCWKRLLDLPPRVARRLGVRFEVLGKKAYLIGGHYISKLDLDEEDRGGTKMKAIDEVYCYDATTNSWNKGVPLTTPRCYFASEVLNGKIYAFGSTPNSDGRQTWETYDPVTNTWTTHSYPDVVSRSTSSTVFNEKIYVRNSSSGEPSRACGAIYEPAIDIWHEADTCLIMGWRDPVVVADGKLFSFDQRPGFKLRMWREDRKKWMVVAKLSSYLWEPPYRVVGIGKSIFFIGKGLSTTKLDVSNVGKGGVLLISDVTEGFGEGRPISCKCMTI